MYIFIYLNIYIYIYNIFVANATPVNVCLFLFFFVIFTTTFLLVHVLETFLLLPLLRFFFTFFVLCVSGKEKGRPERCARRFVLSVGFSSRAPAGMLVIPSFTLQTSLVPRRHRFSSGPLLFAVVARCVVFRRFHFPSTPIRNDSERTSFEQLASVLDLRAQ